jgi:hypothetical protein
MPADPEAVQGLMKWLLKEKVDFRKALTPLVSRGYDSVAKVAGRPCSAPLAPMSIPRCGKPSHAGHAFAMPNDAPALHLCLSWKHGRRAPALRVPTTTTLHITAGPECRHVRSRILVLVVLG